MPEYQEKSFLHIDPAVIACAEEYARIMLNQGETKRTVSLGSPDANTTIIISRVQEGMIVLGTVTIDNDTVYYGIETIE
jgi:hypothetical protein